MSTRITPHERQSRKRFPPRFDSYRYWPVSRKIGFCSGGRGITFPESLVAETSAVLGRPHSNCKPDRPVPSTVKVNPFRAAPLLVLNPEIETFCPAINPFTT